jgi:hypothetical protein
MIVLMGRFAISCAILVILTILPISTMATQHVKSRLVKKGYKNVVEEEKQLYMGMFLIF